MKTWATKKIKKEVMDVANPSTSKAKNKTTMRKIMSKITLST